MTWEDRLSTGRYPEGIVILSLGFGLMAVATVYRTVRGLWEVFHEGAEATHHRRRMARH